MIEIKQPVFIQNETHSRIYADIIVDDDYKNVWFEVENRFEKYLTWERSDAFLVAILHYALIHGHDVICEAPLGEELYYNITTDLIPALANNSDKLKHIKIKAPIDSSSIRIGDAVGTGISCGIDSLHVLAQHSDSDFKNHNVSHLVFNNVGSHGVGEKSIKLYKERRKRSRDFAKDYGFEYIESNSNLHDEFAQVHSYTHTYSSSFAILCLQKLFRKYYYASNGDGLKSFNINNCEARDPSYYELLSLKCFSTSNLVIYSEGCSLTRYEKTINVTHYHPSFKYLNVCILESYNCGRCGKCKRTLYTLDGINKLDSYREVFNIEEYISKRQKYYVYFLCELWSGDNMLKPLYPLLKNKISTSTYILALLRVTYAKIRSKIKK